MTLLLFAESALRITSETRVAWIDHIGSTRSIKGASHADFTAEIGHTGLAGGTIRARATRAEAEFIDTLKAKTMVNAILIPETLPHLRFRHGAQILLAMTVLAM